MQPGVSVVFVFACLLCRNIAGEDVETTHRVVESFGCPENRTLPCIAKCCDLELSHANKTKGNSECVEASAETQDGFWVDFVDLSVDQQKLRNVSLVDRYEFFVGIPCTTGKYLLEPDIYESDNYSIYTNGSLLNGNNLYTMVDYCVDTLNDELPIRVFMCFDSVKPEQDFMHILFPVGQLISIPFLWATALVYLCIEQFRDLQGKSIVGHVFTLSIAFFFLAFVQLAGADINRDLCVAVGFIIQFSFLSCFIWLTVISYDTYANLNDYFRNMYNRGSSKSERRKFLIYLSLSWFGPLLVFVVSAILDLAPGIPDTFLKPGFGKSSCWFGSDNAALPYFFGPAGFFLLINLVFFCLSARIVYKNAKESHELSLQARATEDPEDHQPKKRRKMAYAIQVLKECASLIVIMGISWLAEILSWAIGGSRYIWIATDIINIFQGLLIFYIFVVYPRRIREETWTRVSRFGRRLTRKGARTVRNGSGRSRGNSPLSAATTNPTVADVETTFLDEQNQDKTLTTFR